MANASFIELSKRVSVLPNERWRLQVWVSKTSNNIPGEVFVYQRIPKVPTNPQPQDQFVHVASYADINDFPTENPEDDSPFFRLYYFDVTFRSLAVLNQKWVIVKKQITQTVEDIVRLNNLPPVTVEEVDYPVIPQEQVGLPQFGDNP
jgi:hypothetical protein